MQDATYLKIKTIVEGYWRNVNLEQRYSPNRYVIPIENCPVAEKLKKEIEECQTNLKGNLLLKEKLGAEMKNGVENWDINFWIIQDWGAIHMEQSEKNQDRIKTFFNLLEKTHYASLTAIASFSKVVSFAKPKDYFVYDSRVAYSLNWLLRKAGADSGYFPIPQGQSKLAKHCKLRSVLEIENKTKLNERSAYYEYCQLIKRLYKDICPSGSEPYKLEMLLFQIAPNEVYDEFRTEFLGTDFYCADNSANDNNLNAGQNTVFQNRKIKGRQVDNGELLVIGGNELYVIQGHLKSYYYCELIYKKGLQQEYPFQDELLNEGFVLQGNSKPYLVYYFRKDQADEANHLYERVLERLERS